MWCKVLSIRSVSRESLTRPLELYRDDMDSKRESLLSKEDSCFETQSDVSVPDQGSFGSLILPAWHRMGSLRLAHSNLPFS